MNQTIYTVPVELHQPEKIKAILLDHPEIHFVSLMGIDILGNATDEKIPVKLFLKNLDEFLQYGIQTDGSSVMLNEIATLNNARVDLVPDTEANWFVDSNYDYPSEENGLPVGTLIIPAFLIHDGRKIDSRSILKKSMEYFKNKILAILRHYPYLLKTIGIDDYNDIEDIIFTVGTELEMWVKTPNEKADPEKLSTSQTLKEQYWKRTHGVVRTALEKTMWLLEQYGLKPEMGHKEVGGVESKIGAGGRTIYAMEQLEIDWKYSTALQSSDNDIIVRRIIEDTFTSCGLEVSFAAKPIEGVAGSGKHTHIGIMAKIKDGKLINLFALDNNDESYLSEIGFGALMGLLKNYEIVNPFVTASNDAFNRLKPGFEAPVCIVTSLGHTVQVPSRNRSILVGLVRDIQNPISTRFELRSPNPFSNTYLVLASVYQCMIDGIETVAKANMRYKDLEKDISKRYGENSFYLEKDRAYRSEYDVFEKYSEEERSLMFGTHPATVWENLNNFKKYEGKIDILLQGDVFTKEIINSFKSSTIDKWSTEIRSRILGENMQILRDCKKFHNPETSTDLDVAAWESIEELRHYLMKDSSNIKSLFTRLRDALDNKEYELASKLQVEMNNKMKEVKNIYIKYKKNLLEYES